MCSLDALLLLQAAVTNPIDDYGNIPSAPPTTYSSPSKGSGSGGGYGGYGKVALGGYAGPPAAEKVLQTDGLSHSWH